MCPVNVFRSLVVLGAFALSFSNVQATPRDGVLPDAVVKSLLKVHEQSGNPLPHRLQQHLEEAGELVEEAEQQDRLQQTGSANQRASRQQLLEAKRQEIAGLRQEVVGQLDGVRGRLAGLKLAGKVKAFDRYAQQVAQRFDRIDRALGEAVDARDDQGRRRALGKAKAELGVLHRRDALDEAAPDARPAPTTRLGAEVKPTPAKPSQKLPRYLSANPPVENGANWAFLLDLLGSPAEAAAPATPAEAAACGYAAADLAASEDVVITQEIRDLAAQLGYSPVRIFQHVYNSIRFEPYFGSLKGSVGTLYSGAGGATDQASLLIALLRASNIPARYVLGDVQVVDGSDLGAKGRAPRWLGAKTYQAAASILTSNLNPYAGPLPSNKGIQLRHVWVEACLPYGNYRGAPQDNSGYRWIPLDPSFKDPTYQAGISGIQDNVAFDYSATGYLASRTNTLPHERYAAQVESYVKGLNPDYTLLDVPYSGRQTARTFDILPVTLPYDVVQHVNWIGTSSPEAATLPASHRYQFTIKVRDGSGNVLAADQQLSLPSIMHQRVTLSYVPADSASQSVWNGWNGDLASLPAGLVNLKPVLKTDGNTLVTGTGAITLGTQHRLIMKVTLGDTTLQQASCPNDEPNTTAPDPDLHCFNKTVYTNLKAGAHHALMAYAHQGADRLLAERTDRLIQSVQSAPTAPTPANAANYDATEGELLHIALLKYLRYVTDAGQRLGELNGVSGESGIHLGLTAAGLKVDYLFDLPYTVRPSGPYIDVLGNRAQFVKLDSTATDGATLRAEIWPTFKLMAYSASAYEHAIWQELIRTDAVSTVRGMQFAGESGGANPLVTLNQANIGSWSTVMDPSMNPYQASITGYVNDGSTVTVPKKTIAYTDGQAQPKTWNGGVYMVENQTKGYVAAIINGGLGGGYSLVNPSPVPALYSRDAFVPAAVPATQATNSTTQTNGWTAFISTAGDPVNLATGNLIHSERDLSVPGRGLPLVFERSYNSRGAADGPLGFGWTHSFHHRLKFYGVDGGYVRVGWVDGSGAERFFRLSGSGVPVNSVFQAAPGVYSTLKREADGSWSVTEKNGLAYRFEANAGTTAGQVGRLLSIKDRNLNTLTLSYNADQTLKEVTDGPGRSLAFTYTGGRIGQIAVKAAGGAVLATYQYGYTDGNGNLTSYKSPLAVAGQHPAVTYDYYGAADGQHLNHALKTFSLPEGEGMRFFYYLDGRVFRHQRHKHGTLLPETTTFRYQDFRRETVTVNERGFERRHTFDQNGNPVRIVDETGAAHTYSYDPANPFNRLTETDPAGLTTQYQYDTQGNVTRITQPSGATTEYTDFTTFHAPRRIKDARGNWTLLAYDAKGNLTDTLRLKSGKVPTAGVTPPVGDIAAWAKHAYDGSFGQPAQSKVLRDFAGAVLGNFAGGTGPTLTTTYDAQTLYPTQLSRLGDVTGDGLINASDPADSATQVYDALGHMKQGIDADWHPVAYDYDADGQLIGGTDAVGQPRTYHRDANGRLSRDELKLTQNGQTRLWDSGTYVYDAAGRPAQALDAGGHVTQYAYDAAGNVSLLTDPDGYTLGFDYDPANRWVQAYDKAGHAVTRSLDASGRVKAVTDPNQSTTVYRYWNAAGDGRLKTVTRPAVGSYTGGRATQYDYDALGQVIKLTELPATGSSESSRDTLRTYDALGRLIREAGPAYTDGDPNAITYNQTIRPVTRWVYDPLGHLKQILAGQTAAGGGTTIDPDSGASGEDTVTTQVSYVVDDFGRVLRETDAKGQITLTTYDVHGNVLTRQTANPSGHTLTYQWGYGHQLLSQTAEDGRKVLYTRNPLGEIERAETWSANPGSTLEVAYDYTYDAAHRLDTVTDSRGSKTLVYDWSPGGLLNFVQDSDGHRADYLYDPVGRLIGIWAPNYDSYTFDYDAGGRPLQTTYPNGSQTLYAWNPDDSLSQLSHTHGSLTLAQSAYTHDGLGRRKTLAESLQGLPALTYSYQYDPLDRLTQVDNGTASQRQTYAYDPLGNRVQKQIGNPVSLTLAYKFDAAQQLIEVRQTNLTGPLLEAYLYDGAGHQTQKCQGGTVTRPSDTSCTGASQTQYAFDSFNRLAQLTGSATANFRYDDQGRRIHKTEAGLTTHYRYDGQNLWSEAASPGGSPTAVYVQAGLDRPLARLTDQTTLPTAQAKYYHADGQNSLVALSGQSFTPSQNAAAAKTVTRTAGATYGGGYGDQKLTDGDRRGQNPTTGGLYAGTSGTVFELDFGSPKTLQHIDLFTANNQWNGTPLEPTPEMTVSSNVDTKDLTVQYWTGSAWASLGSVTNNNKVWVTFNTAVTTQKLKITLNDADNVVTLTEVEAWTQPAGDITTQRFDAFGSTLAQTGSIPTYGYTGREPDASGLVYYRARYYDPNQGRFTQRDPLGYLDGVNRYAYVGNNPINFNDPNGLLARQVSHTWDAGANYFASGQFADTLGQTVDAFGGGFLGSAPLPDDASFASQLGRGTRIGVDYGLIAVDVANTFISPSPDVGLIGAAGVTSRAVAKEAAESVQKIKPGSAGGPTAGQRFPESVREAAKAENPTATCVFCQRPGTATQVDHAIPRARGGNATLDNAQLACPHCNPSKGIGDFPKSPPPGYTGPWPP